MNKGSELLINTLTSIKNNTVSHQEQDHNLAMSEAPKLTKELLKIDWEKSANEIHNLVRGLSPFLDTNVKLKDVAICPSSWFILQDDKGVQKRIKVHLSEVVSSSSDKILSLKTDNKTYLNIVTKENEIAILNLQAEGKNPMTIQQFLQGNKINENYSIL